MPSLSLEERFWRHVRTGGDAECWTWQGALLRKGYGAFQPHASDGTQERLAHRIAYYLRYGHIAPEMCVLHRCDNPPCVNPAHLFVGTKADNARDMVAKGRSARGDKHGLRKHPERVASGERHWMRLQPARIPRGSAHARSKLTEADVQAIREASIGHVRYAKDGLNKTIAERFGVSVSVISTIWAGRAWQHVATAEPCDA